MFEKVVADLIVTTYSDEINEKRVYFTHRSWSMRELAKIVYAQVVLYTDAQTELI